MTHDWPNSVSLTASRVDLQPLRVDDASELAPLLDDVALHSYTGGEPASVAELQERFIRQVVGHSPDGCELWFNWVVRLSSSPEAVGMVQATVTPSRPPDVGPTVATLAWVIGTSYQRCGYAKESAHAVAQWARDLGAKPVQAFIHPGHVASEAVARSLGLAPTDDTVDGEVRWADA